MKKKEFDISKYNKSKVLSPKQYKAWAAQIQEKGSQDELEEFNARLATDVAKTKDQRKKLFRKWWLKELISTAVIVVGAVVVNLFTPFSPFSFLLAAGALLVATDLVVFGIIPGIRYLTSKYRGLSKVQKQLANQKQLNETESKELISDLSKQNELTNNFTGIETLTNEKAREILSNEKVLEKTEEVSANEKSKTEKKETSNTTDSTLQNPQIQPTDFFTKPVANQTVAQARLDSDEAKEEKTTVEEVNNSSTSEPSIIEVNAEDVKSTSEEEAPVVMSKLNFGNDEPKSKYVFRVKTRTMTADGTCPNEDVFVNISTTNLDKFIEELSKKNFEEKGLKVAKGARAKKANAIITTVENANEFIDNKLVNKEITAKQAEKLKKQITSVALVLEISSLKNPKEKTFESREYTIEQKDDFFKTVEKVKQNVLKQAKELKAKLEQDEEQVF